MKGESRIDHIEDLDNTIVRFVEKHDDMMKVVEIDLRLLWLTEQLFYYMFILHQHIYY